MSVSLNKCASAKLLTICDVVKTPDNMTWLPEIIVSDQQQGIVRNTDVNCNFEAGTDVDRGVAIERIGTA